MQHQENVDWQMARSHVYGLLGSLLSERPGEKTIDPLLRPEAVDYLETMFADPQVGSRFHQLADQYSTGKISTEQVALDFEGLMRVPGETYTYPYDCAINPRSFLRIFLPEVANFATAPAGVDLEDCPPVFEYTSVSRTSTLTSSPLART